MLRFIQKAYRGQMGAYLRFFVLLLLIAAVLLVAAAISGFAYDECDDSDGYIDESPDVMKPSHQSQSPRRQVQGPASVQAGERINLSVKNQAAFASYVEWSPPPGAANFQFSPQPDNPDTGPPFYFSYLDPGEKVDVSYDPPAGKDKVVDTFTDMFGATAHETRIGGTLAAAAPPVAAPLRPAAPDALVPMWEVTEWLDPQGITLTAALCQEWLTKLQGDEYFLAVRMPVSATNGTYQLPFVSLSSPLTQSIKLFRTSPYSKLITATLEYRPERLTFAANELPSAPGEYWTTLGISSTTPLSCPTGLNAPPGKWHLVGKFLLDLHDLPDACEGCTVRVYGCYEGQVAPRQALGRRALARSLGMESYQGEGITCLGPKPFHLTTQSPVFHLAGNPAAGITPTRPITLSKYLYHDRWGATITATMDYTSTVQGWQFYQGSWDTPYLTAPITAATQIPLPGFDTHYIWAVNNPVPADTEAGPHSLVITVTAVETPTLNTWDTVSLWSGDWVAPPPPLGSKYRVYLPLVLKSP